MPRAKTIWAAATKALQSVRSAKLTDESVKSSAKVTEDSVLVGFPVGWTELWLDMNLFQSLNHFFNILLNSPQIIFPDDGCFSFVWVFNPLKVPLESFGSEEMIKDILFGCHLIQFDWVHLNWAKSGSNMFIFWGNLYCSNINYWGKINK